MYFNKFAVRSLDPYSYMGNLYQSQRVYEEDASCTCQYHQHTDLQNENTGHKLNEGCDPGICT